MKSTRSIIASLLLAAMLAAAFAGGYFFHQTQQDAQQFEILQQAYDLLSSVGIKQPPPPPALEYGMIHGMLDVYSDPHTYFVEPARAELDSQSLQGNFGGIGVRLSPDAGGNWVLNPLPDSPALEAGVVDGDRLLAVEELAITPETTIETIQAAVRGPVGTRVQITVGSPPDYAPREIRIERLEIPLPSVTWHLSPDEPRAGIIEVNLIAASTAEEIQKAVADLTARGATHFILDLRNNPGGLLAAGVEITRLFLKEGVILEQQSRDERLESEKVNSPGALSDIPLAVLINQNSASAAELIAGAMQVQGRAKLIGTPSFGKDTIQSVFELKDHSSLHITSARWWVPGLAPSHGENGLQPDILVTPMDSGADLFIQEAIRSLFGEP